MPMEAACCDLCGSDASRLTVERRDRFSGEPFQYWACEACGLVYLDPRPSANDLASYYPNGYEAYQLARNLSTIARWRRRHALNILRRYVQRFHQRGRLLDAGCATGEFLEEMRSQGWAVRGVEISPQASAAARETYGLQVFTGPLSDYDAPAGTFEVITLWDVLEHLPSPRASLLKAHRLLSSGGTLVFSIPSLESFDARLFGHWWIGWDAPRHLHLFPRQVLERLLAETGFRIRERRCLLGGPGAFQLSLQSWLGERAASGAARILIRTLPLWIWPYKELSYALGRGPVVTVAAQKVE